MLISSVEGVTTSRSVRRTKWRSFRGHCVPTLNGNPQWLPLGGNAGHSDVVDAFAALRNAPRSCNTVVESERFITAFFFSSDEFDVINVPKSAARAHR